MEAKTLLDAIADTAIDTLEQYKVLIGQSRFVEANECLGAVERLTSQAHHIEDHVDYNETNIAKAYNIGKEIREG